MKQDYKTSVPQAELDASKDERERLLKKWGYEPTSFWILPKIHNATLDALVGDTLAAGSYETHDYSVRSGALPQSSPIVADRLIRFYSEPGEMVGNPFAERIPHLLVANYRGRHAFGQDLCKKFIAHDIEKVMQRIKSAEFLNPEENKIIEQTDTKFVALLNGLNFELRLGDSRKIDLPDNSWDFCVNSPAYFSTIKYDDNPNQLGTGKNNAADGKSPTYEEFLKGLQDVYKEVYRILKPGRFNAVILNDFRLDKHFYAFHMDTTRICQEIGWILHDLIVYPLSYHPLMSIFSSELERDKIQAKQHETILILRKPK